MEGSDWNLPSQPSNVWWNLFLIRGQASHQEPNSSSQFSNPPPEEVGCDFLCFTDIIKSTNFSREGAMADYAHPEALVSTQWVEEHMNDPKVRLV